MAQDVIEKIRAAAQAKGIDPEVALGIARAESGLDPNAKAKSSTASGLFQILNKTWSGNKGAPGKQFDTDENIRVGTDIISQNVNSLKKFLGRDPSPKEVYAAHYFGATGAQNFLSAAPDTPTAKIFSEKVLEANPNLKNKTAAQVLAQLEGKLKIPASNVPRETIAKKEREPLPASLPPMAEASPTKAPAATVAMASGKDLPDIKSLPASYQAAFALAALADAKDDEKEYDEDKETESEKMMREYKPVNHLASLDLSVTPIMMKDGGDVEGRPRSAKSLMEKFKDLTSEYQKDPIAFMRHYKVPTSPMGQGLNAGYAVYKHVTGKDPLLDLQKELSQRLNPETDTGDADSMPISVGLPPIRRAEGSPEEGERLTPQQIERIAAQGPTERKDEPIFDAASRTFVDVLTGRRTPITEKDFTAKEQMAMMDAVRRSQARGGKGRVGYEDYPTGEQIGPDYVDIRNTLGGFQYKQNPDGSTIISDRYDFHGPRVAEYEKMGTGEKVLKSAKNALTEFVTKGFSPRDLAGELGRAYVGSKGPEVNIRIPVNRADGSPKEGERKLDRETIALMRGEGMQPAAMQRVKPPLELNPSAAGLPGLMMYNDPSLPGTGTAGYVMVGDDNAKNPAMAQAMFLNPKDGNKADTIAHETEHLLARQNLGRGSNINTKFDELIGDNGLKRIQFVQKAVQAAPYLKEKYGLQSAYFQPEMVEFQGRRAKNLLYEQLASLAALEQRHKVDLTKDEELRKTLFARPDVRETYNALTGLRQTRLDPRDLPPHTRVPEPGMLDAIKKVFKRADGGPVYRADGSPEEGERLTPQQIEQRAAQDVAEREAASTAAFIAQKSGIGRKAGPVSQALQSGQGQIEFLKGMTNVPQNILGAPMDISNMVANVYGGGVEKPFMGSEYLKEKSRAAGLGFKPSTDPTLAGFYGAGDLGSNLVNPAGVTRAGVQAAGKTGEAARMLAQDFQQYNQNLAVPGASYAIRNRSTPFIMTPERTTVSGQIVPEMNEADAYADRVARTVDTGANLRTDNPALANWFRTKVGAYLRRDFGTEQDQMVQAADKGLKMHFTSPRFLENNPYLLNPNTIGTGRELEGFPKAGFAKTAKGQEAEAIVDSSIYPLQLQDVSEKYVPSNMRQFRETNPEMRLSEMGSYVDENLKLETLADEMDKMFKETVFKAYGEQVPMPKDYILTEDTLKGLTPAQASNRVAKKQEWVIEKRGELAGVAIAKDPQIVSHSYDNGSKWISPPDLADNARHEEMVKDIGCAGGWCTDKSTYALDYGSGENRLNILLDKKFEPRVQLTVNSPPISVREFILANPHLPEIDALTRDRTLTSKRAEAYIKTMPEYQDFVKQNQNTKSITEIKGQFNNADLKSSPYLKQVQDFVKRQGPDLQSVHNLDGIDMLDMRTELPTMRQYGRRSYSQGLLDKLLQLNGNSYFVDKYEFPELITKAYEQPNNAARQIQMNMFQPPTERATGGMIERQPTDNRRYL